MKFLFLLNDPSCGSERSRNALRPAHAIVQKKPEADADNVPAF